MVSMVGGCAKKRATSSQDRLGKEFEQMMTGATADRVMNAVLKMKKFDLDALNRAYAGQG